MHAVFHDAPLQFSSCTLCSTMHGCSSRHARCVPECTVAVLVMTLCPTMKGWVLDMLAVFHNARFSSRSNLHGCSSPHARCVPKCTVAVLVTHAMFHNAQLSFNARSVTQCTVAGIVMHAVFHNARLRSRHARCVPRCTVMFSTCTLCSTMHGWVLVPQCMVAVLVMHAVPECKVEFSSCTLGST